VSAKSGVFIAHNIVQPLESKLRYKWIRVKKRVLNMLRKKRLSRGCMCGEPRVYEQQQSENILRVVYAQKRIS